LSLAVLQHTLLQLIESKSDLVGEAEAAPNVKVLRQC
jgi:hypothetical protein